MVIIRMLRSPPYSKSVKVLKTILQMSDESHEISGGHFTIQYAKEIKIMVGRGDFTQGIDIEQVIWGIEQFKETLQSLHEKPK